MQTVIANCEIKRKRQLLEFHVRRRYFLTLNCLPYTETVPILLLARHTENHTKPDETLEACQNQSCEKKVNCVGGERNRHTASDGFCVCVWKRL